MPTPIRHTIRVRDAEVPALLLQPVGASCAPAALLLHGYRSRKELMTESIGQALLSRGVASLSIDLPLHGERPERLDEAAMQNPITIISTWRGALAECGAALDDLAGRRGIDPSRLAIVGYSMGSFLGVLAAANRQDVRALVVAAGGDMPSPTPFERLLRRVADPLKAVRRLAGRPLLMVHGRRDRTVAPEQATRLFEAAGDPKELRWYDGGHALPDGVIGQAADWLAERLALGDARSPAAGHQGRSPRP